MENVLWKAFIDYVEKEWSIDDGLSIVDLEERFKINRRHVRYYLLKLLRQGYLCQIKIGRSTYYALPIWRSPFEELKGKVKGLKVR